MRICKERRRARTPYHSFRAEAGRPVRQGRYRFRSRVVHTAVVFLLTILAKCLVISFGSRAVHTVHATDANTHLCVTMCLR